MSLEQLHCYQDESELRQSLSKSTQQQSLQSIATFKSEQSIESLEKLVSQEQAKDSNLRVELDQFIGLLQKVKPSNLKNELSIVMSTEQEEYYSFQQKQPQDKKEVMFEGFQKCYNDSIRLINNSVKEIKDQKTILQQLEKMQMIYIMHIQSYQGMERSVNLINSLKQTLIDADQEITLLHSQTTEQQSLIHKLQSQIKSLSGELNQERLNSMDFQQKNQQLKHLIFVANKQFEALQEKLLQTEEELNQVVSQQGQQIIQLVQANKHLREAVSNSQKDVETREDSTFNKTEQYFIRQDQQFSNKIHNQENLSNHSNQNTQQAHLQLQLQQPLSSYRKQTQEKNYQNTSPQTTQRSTSNKREWNKCTKIFK